MPLFTRYTSANSDSYTTDLLGLNVNILIAQLTLQHHQLQTAAAAAAAVATRLLSCPPCHQ